MKGVFTFQIEPDKGNDNQNPIIINNIPQIPTPLTSKPQPLDPFYHALGQYRQSRHGFILPNIFHPPQNSQDDKTHFDEKDFNIRMREVGLCIGLGKAMKSSPLPGLFCGSKFWEFSLGT